MIGLVVLALLLPTAAIDAQVAAETRITHVASARLRAAPRTDAAVVGTLALGTEFSPVAQSPAPDVWYRLGGGQGERWVRGDLTTALTAETRLETIERVITDRLAQENQSLTDLTELVHLVERLSGELPDRELRARFALHGVRALRAVTSVLPSPDDTDLSKLVKSWPTNQKREVSYDFSGHRWVVEREPVLGLYKRYRGTAAGDDILWEFVRTGPLGECEGDMPCYLSWINTLEGEYLRREPTGKHAADAVAQMTEDLVAGLTYPDFHPATDCEPTLKAIETLRKTLAPTKAPDRDQALAALDRLIDKWCRLEQWTKGPASFRGAFVLTI